MFGRADPYFHTGSKNKHCEDGEFCNAEEEECFGCYYPGGLVPGSTACDRYENACDGYACDGSDFYGDAGQGGSAGGGGGGPSGVFAFIDKLTASDAAANDYFGISVAIDGNTVVVGADQRYTGTGSAYVFLTTDGGATYGLVAKLTAADGYQSARFGASVAIDGGTIVVGAIQYWRSGSGAVYVFRTSDGGVTYGQVAKLTATDGTASDNFGYSRLPAAPSWWGH